MADNDKGQALDWDVTEVVDDVPSSASDRFSFVSERISLYEMPVKQENRNMSRTR